MSTNMKRFQRELPRWFLRLHVSSQNLVIYLALALLPVLTITIVVVTVFYHSMRDQIKRSISNSMMLLSLNMDGLATRIEDTSTTIVNSERVQGYLLSAFENVHVSRPELFSAEQGIAIFFDSTLMRSIALYDLDGNLLQFPMALSNEWLWVVSHQNDGFHHRPIWINDTEGKLIHVLRPVESTRNYNRIGFLDITLYPEVFKRQFVDMDVGKGGEIALFDERGNIIAGFLQNSSQILPLLGNESGMEVVGSTYVFYQKIPTMNWIVVCAIPWRTALLPVFRLMGFVLLGIVAISLIVFLISLAYARYTTHRIQRIVDAMSRFAHGDSNACVPVDENPEFRKLGAHFNDMVQRIASLIDSEYKSKLLQNQAELKMLQAQINPHFLYNTLNVIYWKAQIAHQSDIARMAIALSDLLRVSIDSNVEFLTVKEEMRNVDDYLFIQRMRYQDKVSLSIDVPDQYASCLIPKLVIQPVVENAFVHGLEPKTGHGSITIAVRDEGESLVFTVVDDGVGMDAETVTMLLVEQKGKGFQGLLNVQRRLQLSYGPGYGVSIRSALGKGTTVEIRIHKEEGGHVSGIDC
ncbi:MAG: sensor histidine kinase [Spirochaetaceae bacterium]|nr:sensor histidine kinase [Spirochaetaceae bacterium]